MPKIKIKYPYMHEMMLTAQGIVAVGYPDVMKLKMVEKRKSGGISLYGNKLNYDPKGVETMCLNELVDLIQDAYVHWYLHSLPYCSLAPMEAILH